ncbi:MAG: hypothetical protein H8K07_09910 [Nitrospira sp.]|nr:hypothetical protein [Nitrospira sp.]MDI3462625.1 hypothetical protein [Nitrospira sp.]
MPSHERQRRRTDGVARRSEVLETGLVHDMADRVPLSVIDGCSRIAVSGRWL